MKEERITIELTSKSMMDLEHIPFTDFTINCRKAPFFRYGDIRQGFIKNVRKVVVN